MNVMELREHQKECVDKIREHFVDDNKALIKMFCGVLLFVIVCWNLGTTSLLLFQVLI